MGRIHIQIFLRKEHQVHTWIDVLVTGKSIPLLTHLYGPKIRILLLVNVVLSAKETYFILNTKEAVIWLEMAPNMNYKQLKKENKTLQKYFSGFKKKTDHKNMFFVLGTACIFRNTEMYEIAAIDETVKHLALNICLWRIYSLNHCH